MADVVWIGHRPTRKEAGSLLKMLGVVVGIIVALLLLWVLVDMAWYLWGGLGALILSFLLIFFVLYLVDRRKVKEYEDSVAEADRFS